MTLLGDAYFGQAPDRPTEALRHPRNSLLIHTKQELRKRLLDSLSTTHVLDHLKALLRAKLVEELHASSSMPGLAPRRDQPHGQTLHSQALQDLFKIADSLILDYLQARGYEFSLSVFGPESGLTYGKPSHLARSRSQPPQPVLSANAFIKLLSLDKSGVDMQSVLTSREPSNHGVFLSKLLDRSVISTAFQTESDLHTLIETSLSASVSVTTDVPPSLAQEKAFKELESRLKHKMERQLEAYKAEELEYVKSEIMSEKERAVAEVVDAWTAKLRLAREEAARDVQVERESWMEREKELMANMNELRRSVMQESNDLLRQDLLSRQDLQRSYQTLKLEHDMLHKKHQQVLADLAHANQAKEEHLKHMHHEMAQYKVQLHKEHASAIAAVEVERAKLDAERALVRDRAEGVERMASQLKLQLNEPTQLRETLKAMHAENEQLRQEKRAISTQCATQVNELNVKLSAAEKKAEEKSAQYDALLQQLIGGHELLGSSATKGTLVTKLEQSRKSALRWQKECSSLVSKLDAELDRSESLKRALDKAGLQNKSLKREVAQLQLKVHQLKSRAIEPDDLASSTLNHYALQPTSKSSKLAFGGRTLETHSLTKLLATDNITIPPQVDHESYLSTLSSIEKSNTPPNPVQPHVTHDTSTVISLGDADLTMEDLAPPIKENAPPAKRDTSTTTIAGLSQIDPRSMEKPREVMTSPTENPSPAAFLANGGATGDNSEKVEDTLPNILPADLGKLYEQLSTDMLKDTGSPLNDVQSTSNVKRFTFDNLTSPLPVKSNEPFTNFTSSSKHISTESTPPSAVDARDPPAKTLQTDKYIDDFGGGNTDDDDLSTDAALPDEEFSLSFDVRSTAKLGW